MSSNRHKYVDWANGDINFADWNVIFVMRIEKVQAFYMNNLWAFLFLVASCFVAWKTILGLGRGRREAKVYLLGNPAVTAQKKPGDCWQELMVAVLSLQIENWQKRQVSIRLLAEWWLPVRSTGFANIFIKTCSYNVLVLINTRAVDFLLLPRRHWLLSVSRRHWVL